MNRFVYTCIYIYIYICIYIYIKMKRSENDFKFGIESFFISNYSVY